METKTESSMTKLIFFYIVPSVKKEIENALDEIIDYPCDIRLKITIPSMGKIESIRSFLMECIVSEPPCDFELENREEYEIEKLRLIRVCFLNYVKFLQKKMIDTKDAQIQVDYWAEICEMSILYKDMITNPDYGLTMWFKSFILKNLQFIKENGMLPSFLVVCEFCPDFVTDDCYPIIDKGRSASGHRPCLTKVLLNELLHKHYNKWKKYMQPQVFYSIERLL